MSRPIDRRSQLDGYLRAYYSMLDILTDFDDNPKDLSIDDTKYWVGQLKKWIEEYEGEIINYEL